MLKACSVDHSQHMLRAVEDQLIVGIIGTDSGAAMQFRLAPAYSLYMLLRCRLSSLSESQLTVVQRDKHLGMLTSKMAQYLQHIVEVSLTLCTIQCVT